LGMLVLALVFGMTVAGCDDGGNKTIYDPVGTWTATVQGQSATLTITAGNTWTMTANGSSYNGTFSKNGNVGRLSSGGTNIGTATMTSNTTMTLTLNNNSYFPGTYSATKQ